MPQIMSGRYYHRSILHSFESREHPREYYFVEPEPTAVLLPELLRSEGTIWPVSVRTPGWWRSPRSEEHSTASISCQRVQSVATRTLGR